MFVLKRCFVTSHPGDLLQEVLSQMLHLQLTQGLSVILAQKKPLFDSQWDYSRGHQSKVPY